MSEYEDTDGRPILRGHLANTPIGEYILFRTSELLEEKEGKAIK